MPHQQMITRKKPAKKDPDGVDDRSRLRSKEESEESSDLTLFQARHGLELLQDQVGNLTVQQVLSQGNGGPAIEGPGAVAHVQRQLDQASEEETEDEAQEAEREEEAEVEETQPPETELEKERREEDTIEVGEIEIEKPEIEYYQIEADSLEEAISQIEKPEDWYEVEYDYEVETENDLVISADITVAVTLRLPQWSGPGWEGAMPPERARWEELLAAFPQYDDKIEETGELPSAVLQGAAWEDAPQPLKTEWRAMLQDLQNEEGTLLNTIHRRAVVLQQRLLNQPESEVSNIFDEFMGDLEDEEKEYARQREVGEESDISLGGNVILQ